MSDGTSVAAVGVEDDTVGAGGAWKYHALVNRSHPIQSLVYISRIVRKLERSESKLTASVNATPENRELLPRSGDSEVKAFVVVVTVRVVVAADLLVGFEIFAALGDGGGDLRGGVALLVEIVLGYDWEMVLEWGCHTVLPQVTAPWRFSIRAGAARVDAARAKTARIEVYMVMSMSVWKRIYVDERVG